MLKTDSGKWYGEPGHIGSKSYVCGYQSCGMLVSSERGWIYNDSSLNRSTARIHICTHCHRPTYFQEDIQYPHPPLGRQVKGLPSELEALHHEVLDDASSGRYVSAILVARTMLMYIAVEKGAEPGKKFVEYIDYLELNHYTPPNSKKWIDKIREQGNGAAHEIGMKTKEDAEPVLKFLEMLLTFIYEYQDKS